MSTTVDEFGRVIPAATPLASSRGGPRNEPPPPPTTTTTTTIKRDRGRSQSPPPYRGGGRGRGRGRSSRHYSTHHSTTSSRDRDRDRDRDYHRDRDHHTSGGGGGSTTRDHHRRDRDHHHHSSSSRHQHHHHHHHHHDGGGGASRGRDRDSGGGREWRKRRRSPSSSGPSSLQGHPPSQQHTTASSVDGGLGASSPPRSTSRLRHPSYRYVEEPMLCEYVWKSQHEGDKNDNTNKNDDAEGENNDTAIDDSSKNNNSNANTNDDSSINDKKPTLVVKEEPQDDDNENNNNDKDEPENENYHDYRKKYCLNYVRSFFNQHMDDSWFRNRYSPLGKKRTVLAERERAKHEAQVFGAQLQASLQQQQQQESSPNNNSSEDRCSFVQQARLGGGIKTSSSNNADLVVPATHKLSIANPDNVLHITDVPPHITDEQLHLALMYHCMIPADEQAEGSPVMAPDATKLVSGTVIADRDKNPLWREAFFICSAAVKQDIVVHLAKAEAEGDLAAAAAASTTTSTAANASASAADKSSEAAKASEAAAVVVPRKEKDKDDKIRAMLPLDVECSDPYGRLDVDADGKGGAPEDGVGVPPRKSTVWVNTQYKPPPVLVLSAAVSSKERLGRDKEAAIMMARALDVAKDIPPDHRLDEVLDKLFGVNRNTQEAEDPSIIEDTLDVAIAYLRRVHLFSFYNGCTFASSVADVLSGRHPAGTIHLRLKNADEILAQDNPPSKSVEYGDNNVVVPPKDLLVSRLDASIASALEECNQWINSGGSTIVSEQEDQEAAELEHAEEEWKDTWLENHAIIDDDGRARCSFHFCHKLFKDKNFLRKHLLKKHREFLRAEQAQLHDEYMMKAWDEEDQRPVPPILVDCGANFDLVPSAVVGAEPTAEDPEPELWRKEEERRKREEEMREQRQQQRRNRENQSEHSNPTGGGEERRSHHSNAPPPRVKNFVDPDDMKEEKVEMSFDNIDVPVQPPKKKKKKKKLL